MRFDVFVGLQAPEFMGFDVRAVHHQALDEIALAEQAGFGGAWLVEHHFMPEFSQCSAPEVMFGAITQRTEKMRIGSAVTVPTINHPVRVAERVATLDLLSDGRIDVGVGRGNWAIDYEVFGGGATMAEGRGRVYEAVEIMKQCWGDEPFAWDGEYWKFPEINVFPKPIQKPPKLWAAAVSPESYTTAAEKGMGVLAGPFKPLFMVAEDRVRYVERCREMGHDPRELGFAMTMGIVVADDHKTAIEIAQRNIRWYFEQLLALTAPLLTRSEEDYHYYREDIQTLRNLSGGNPSLEALQSGGMLVAGSPETVIEQFHNLAAHGIDHLICTVQAGGVPHEDVMRTIELMGEHVIPAMKDVQGPDGRPKKLPKRDLTVWLREAPEVTPEVLMESMQMVFRRDLADGFTALYRVDLDGDGGGTWFIDIADGDCQVGREVPDRSPDVRIKSDTDTWIEIAKGERGQASAVLRRKLKIAGNPLKAARFKSLFN